MFIKAAYTIENAVVLPVFVMIIICLTAMTCYIHDRAVMKNAVMQAAIECVKLSDSEDNDALAQRVQDYITAKTIFMKSVHVRVRREGNKKIVECDAVFGLLPSIQGMQKTAVCADASIKKPSETIWITNAMEEVVDHE